MNTYNHSYEDMRDVMDALENTVHALKGFSTLLNISLQNAGGDLQHDTTGISILLNHQISDLDDIRRGLQVEVNAIRKSKLVLTSPRHAASVYGLPVATVIGITRMMTGVGLESEGDTSPAAEEETATNPKQLRDDIIAEQLKAGVSEAEISQAIGVRKTAIERVKRKLEADELPDGQSPDQTAVNG
ncbi:hypothetical protein [Pararhizobium gei]|uniref:hypothetical protein n=1 Tax=Pararhizobium gei TaxID=1395951 RepID=UPI0023DC1002|nr:hypothetical protein [Rhizobium gei]